MISQQRLEALCVPEEVREVQAVGKLPLRLRYKGQMEWSRHYGIDSRMWDVLSPRLKTYDYSSGGYPTFTTEGLKQEGLIK